MSRNQNYYSSSRLSASFFKALAKGIGETKKFLEQGEVNYNLKSNFSLKFGNAIDCLITQPQFFGETYEVVRQKLPSDKLILIIDSLFKDFSNYTPGELSNDIIRRYCKLHDYYAKDESKAAYSISQVKDQLWYFEFLKKTKDKILLTEEEYEGIKYCKNLLRNHEYTKSFFDLMSDPRINYQFQKEIYWQYDPYGIECKSLLDLILVNKSNDKILLPNGFEFPGMSALIIDIKHTSLPIENIEYQCKQYDYPFQLMFYKQAVFNTINPKFNVLNPIILAVSPISKYPVWIQLTDTECDIFHFGGVYSDRTLQPNYDNVISDKKSIGELIDLYKTYLKQDQWEVRHDIFQNKGKIIGVYGDTEN